MLCHNRGTIQPYAGGTEKKHERTQYNGCPDQDSNWELHKFRALQILLTCSVTYLQTYYCSREAQNCQTWIMESQGFASVDVRYSYKNEYRAVRSVSDSTDSRVATSQSNHDLPHLSRMLQLCPPSICMTSVFGKSRSSHNFSYKKSVFFED
jgi:hypothetical protein